MPCDFTQLGHRAPGENVAQKPVTLSVAGNEWSPLRGHPRKIGQLVITSLAEKGITE